jgi:hypothetical protein
MSMPSAAEGTEPQPVVPLHYFERSREPLKWVVRLVALMAIVDGALVVSVFLLESGFLLWQSFIPTVAARISLQGWQWLGFGVPGAASGMVFVVGGGWSLRLRPIGRRTIMIGALLMIIVTIASSVVSAVLLHSRVSGLPPGYFIYQTLNNATYTARHCVLPAVVWYFFRRPEVFEVFQSKSCESEPLIKP